MSKENTNSQENSRDVRRVLIVLLAGASWLLLMLSLGSYRVSDWPNHGVYPHGEVQNLCGPVGAWLAYQIHFLLGQGIYPIMMFAAVWIGAYAAKVKLSDPALRVAGVLLISLSFAALMHLIRPGGGAGSGLAVPEGQGGLLGIAISTYLYAHLNMAGTLICLFTCFVVGLILAADEVVAFVPVAFRKMHELRQSISKNTQTQTVGVEKLAGEDPVSSDPNGWLGALRKLVSKPREIFGQLATAGVGMNRSSGNTSNLPQRDYSTAPGPSSVPDDTSSMNKPVLLNRHNLSDREIELSYAHDEASDASDLDGSGGIAVLEDDLNPQPAEAVIIPPKPLEEEPESTVQTGVDDAEEDVGLTAGSAAGAETVAGSGSVLPAAQEEKRSEIKINFASAKPKPTAPQPARDLGDYQLPSWEVLAEPEEGFAQSQGAFVREKAELLEQCMREFKLDARVVSIDTGPVITLYELAIAPGIKVSSITALQNDIARALSATSVRIVAPVPGKDTVGIEVPNAQKEKVRLRELFELSPAAAQKMAIPLYLGKDASGEPLVTDLTAMPHCLIAGTTNSGKSVCISTIIMSVMYMQRPDMVKLILIDPKVVEMALFKDIPHLMCPVINDPNRATAVLEWACNKMDERYGFLAEAGVRNIASYNKLTREELMERFKPTNEEEEAKIPKHLPFIVIVIDELADLMMTSGKEVENFIVRLAQKSRAVGIHLIVATQRPQATVVTGLIKSNLPSRISFRVQSRMDSRIVLDQPGADVLLGQGDMLFMPPGANKPIRAQGTFIDDLEIRSSVKLVKELADAQYEPELVQIKAIKMDGEFEKDDLFEDAVRVVLETKRGSVSLLQRRLSIGYARASRLIEMMAHMGIVGEFKGEGQPRDATMTLEEYEILKAQAQKDKEDGMTV